MYSCTQGYKTPVPIDSLLLSIYKKFRSLQQCQLTTKIEVASERMCANCTNSNTSARTQISHQDCYNKHDTWRFILA